jgi:hypothetical protein
MTVRMSRLRHVRRHRRRRTAVHGKTTHGPSMHLPCVGLPHSAASGWSRGTPGTTAAGPSPRPRTPTPSLPRSSIRDDARLSRRQSRSTSGPPHWYMPRRHRRRPLHLFPQTRNQGTASRVVVPTRPSGSTRASSGVNRHAGDPGGCWAGAATVTTPSPSSGQLGPRSMPSGAAAGWRSAFGHGSHAASRNGAIASECAAGGSVRVKAGVAPPPAFGVRVTCTFTASGALGAPDGARSSVLGAEAGLSGRGGRRRSEGRPR